MSQSRKSGLEKIEQELRDFFGIHAKQQMTPEMKARIERIQARERAILASKYGRKVKVKKSTTSGGMYTKDPMSDNIEMVSGDMYKMPEKLDRDARSSKGKILSRGQWRDFNYYNITEKSRTIVGTASEIEEWFDGNDDKAIAFNLETDMWDLAFDADYGTYELTVEIGISTYGTDVQPKYLGGKTAVVNEVVKNVVTTGGQLVGGVVAGKLSTTAKGATTLGEAVKDTVDAVEQTAELVVEHTGEHGKKSKHPQVLDKDSVIANMKIKVEIYAGQYQGRFKDEKFHLQHTWARTDLETGQISAERQRCDRYFIWMSDVGAQVLRMLPTLFAKMEVEGAMI